MWKLDKNDKYTSIAIYAFIVLAVTITAVAVGLNLPLIWAEFARLFALFIPALLGFSLAYICNPLVRFAERMILPRLKRRSLRMARLLALVFTYLTVLLILTVLFLMIVPQIVLNYNDFAQNVTAYLSSAIATVDAWIRETGIFGADYNGLGDLIQTDQISSLLTEWIGVLAEAIGRFSLRIIESVGYVLLGAILSAYFLFHKELILATLKKISLAILPRRVYRFFSDIISFSDRAFGQFIVGKLFDSLIVGVIAFVVFAIVGIPYYPLISAIVCVTSVIPAFGYLIGAIPAAFIILMKDPMMALWFLIILLIIQQIDGNIIGPKIVGSATGLASVWVITAIMLFGSYFGVLGWFIGVPLFSVLYRLVGDIANRSLEKKHLPTSLEHYKTAAITEEAPRTVVRKEDDHEEMDQ